MWSWSDSVHEPCVELDADDGAAGIGALSEDVAGNGALVEDDAGIAEPVEAVGESMPVAGSSSDCLCLLIPRSSSVHLSHVSKLNLLWCRSTLS